MFCGGRDWSASARFLSFRRPKILIKKLEEVKKLVFDKSKTATFLHKGSPSMFWNNLLLPSLS